MQKFKVPAREHSEQKNKTLLLFPVHGVSCVDIRILQVTMTLLEHLQMEQIVLFVFCLVIIVIKHSFLGSPFGFH